jgi:hypothetical protein
MRRLVAITLAGSLMFAIVPGAALAGDRHARGGYSEGDVWAGVALGATAAVIGGVLLNAITSSPAPVAPPVAYTAPPVVYTPPPSVLYVTPPPVVYAPIPPVSYRAPVVIYKSVPEAKHRHWAPKKYRNHGSAWPHEREYGWRDR